MSEIIFDWRKLNLQSCDILLCSGNGDLSRKIQKFQRIVGFSEEAAAISHIAGIVYMTYEQLVALRKLLGIWIEVDLKGLYILESTTLNKWCNKSGVQINPMSEWLYYYDGKVYVRQLDFVRDEEFYRRDFEFIKHHINDPYENGIAGGVELLLCGLMLSRYIRLASPNWKPAATKTPHCSENEAGREKHHKLLKDIAIENRMPPAVWTGHKQKKLFINGAMLDDNLLVPISVMKRIK